MCRKTHAISAYRQRRRFLGIVEGAGKWYHRRRTRGAVLRRVRRGVFFDPVPKDYMAIAAGTLVRRRGDHRTDHVAARRTITGSTTASRSGWIDRCGRSERRSGRQSLVA
jgi:hypothetical protein